MPAPHGFSWIDKPKLGALARPSSLEEMQWLRQQGIQVLVSLTEDRPRRGRTREAGGRGVSRALADMEAPTQEQLDRAVSAIRKALDRDMAVAVHCGAGLGRTGVVLAAYLVNTGLTATKAIARVRQLRPHSIETPDQAEAIELYA